MRVSAQAGAVAAVEETCGSPGLPDGAAVDSTAITDPVMEVKSLNAWYGSFQSLHNICMRVARQRVTALIGPSGCGKSTFIRCLNRMHEMAPGARAAGQVLLEGEDIYDPQVDPVAVRRAVGMVFQKPNPFPAYSIFENVAAGLTLARVGRRFYRSQLAEVVERSLRQAALWDEVKDRLRQPATTLSGGQQQRLCIARALAVEPKVLLMDEPAAALDPISTLKIEELILSLKEQRTIVIVTHNMQQAARIADYTAFMLMGELIEFGPTAQVFTTPRDKRCEDYITGRFG